LEFVSTQVAIAIDRKQAEAALKESETRYRGLFEHSPVSLWEEDFSEVKRHIEELRKSGVTDFRAFFESHPQVLLECVDEINVLDVNAATLALMHAASKSQLIGSLQQVFRADASKDFVDEIVSISEGLTEFTWESLNYTLDGQKLTVSLKRSAAPGYENTLEKVLISVLDITERKRAEEEIKTILRTTIDGFYRVDQAGRIVEVNDAYCSMIGYSRAELLEMYVKDIEAVESGKVIKERIQRIVNTGSDRFETRHRRKDGKVIDIEASVNYLANAQGNIFCFMRDVTARKQAEDQIRQLNASLEERVDARTRELGAAQEQLVIHEKLATLGQLAGGVGHELRNPLGVINSAVYYLKLVQPDADEKIKKYHRMIEQEVNTAGRIINDLLDFGRIVSPDRQPVSVPELVQHVLTRFPAPPSIQVQLRIPARLPKIFADPLHMEQVLGNLTTNACQAMKDGKDSGKLTISASLKKDQVAIAIQDTGTGITPEAMQRLFEPLFTTKLRGIGLGLAVSKKLAEANGGRITVHSELGQGSTFTLYLPVNA